MDSVIHKVLKNGIRITLNPDVYAVSAILSTAYLFKKYLLIIISHKDDEKVEVDFIGPEMGKIESIVKDFLSELIDQQIRHNIHEQTKHIHELIVKEAFSPLEKKCQESKNVQ